jgi:phosphoglycerol transferase MdoB-like AlkP superfamily enzyme
LFEALRLFESIYYWKTLLEYGTQALYTALTGAIWFVSGALLVWGLWHGKRWAWLGSLIAAFAFMVWYWLDRLLLQQSHSNGTFAVIASSLMLLLVLLILLTRRTRHYLLGKSA